MLGGHAIVNADIHGGIPSSMDQYMDFDRSFQANIGAMDIDRRIRSDFVQRSNTAMVPLERERDRGVSATAYAGRGRTVEWHGPEYMKPQQRYRPPPEQRDNLFIKQMRDNLFGYRPPPEQIVPHADGDQVSSDLTKEINNNCWVMMCFPGRSNVEKIKWERTRTPVEREIKWERTRTPLERVTVPQQYTTYQNKSHTVNSPLETWSTLTQYWAGSAPDVQYQYATAGSARPPSIAPSIQYVRPLPQQQIVVRSVSRPSSPAAPSVQYAHTRGREKREILHGPNIQLKQLMAQQEVQQYEQEGVYIYIHTTV